MNVFMDIVVVGTAGPKGAFLAAARTVDATDEEAAALLREQCPPERRAAILANMKAACAGLWHCETAGHC